MDLGEIFSCGRKNHFFGGGFEPPFDGELFGGFDIIFSMVV
jgi:hypothetical protein